MKKMHSQLKASDAALEAQYKQVEKYRLRTFELYN